MDSNLEKRLLIRILKDPTFAQLAQERNVDDSIFLLQANRALWKVSSYAVLKCNSFLTDVLLKDLLTQSTTFNDDLKQSITVLFASLQSEQLDDTDPNVLLDLGLSYSKSNLVEGVLRRSVELLSDKKVDMAVETLKSNITRIENKFKVEEARSGQLDEFAQRIHWEHDDRKQNPQKYEGIKIGYSQFDNITGGLVKTSVSMLVAPWKGFKSCLAMNIARNIASKGKYVYYHANEGTIELFYMRYAAMELGIPLKHIKDGLMDQMEESRWLQFINCVEQGQHLILNKIYFDEIPLSLSTPTYINQKLQDLKKEGKNVDFVICDHFGRMRTTDKNVLQDWQMKGAIAQEICNIAQTERIPFLLLSHAKVAAIKEAREEGKDIDPESLERSAQPLKDVDYAWSFVIENQDEFDRQGKKGFARLALTLSRHSETGAAILHIDGKYMRITEPTIGGSQI